MRQDDDHIGKEGTPNTPPEGKRRKRDPVRPSMRREFMELFRDTRVAAPETAGAGSPPAEAPQAAQAQAPVSARTAGPTSTTEPSPFLRRFLQQSDPAPEPARSGLSSLDGHLGGGFGPGVHPVLGPTGTVRTAFLEAVAWEAVGNRRPVLYYALRTGTLGVWERLMGTLSTILDGPDVAPAALRGQELVPEALETLARLDAALQASVLPYLSLIEHPDSPVGDLSTFIASVLSHGREATEQHGHPPLVLVDGVDQLLPFTGSLPPVQVISRLDEALEADSLPGLLAADLGGDLEEGGGSLPCRTILRLETPDYAATLNGGRTDLDLLQNLITGWTGRVPLLLDPHSGLFAEA